MTRRPGKSARASGKPPGDTSALTLEFDDGRLLGPLFGQFDQNLIALENRLGVFIAARGNRLTIEGDGATTAQARDALMHLYKRAQAGQSIDLEDVEAAVSLSMPVAQTAGVRSVDAPADLQIRTRKKVIQPRSPTQIEYMAALRDQDIVFALGPAGTGKTYIAVAQAVAQLVTGGVDRIILSRPAVEAGERLGFLPGDMKEKVDPYLRPLYDALYDMLPADQVERRITTSGEIEIAPLAFMRGRTLSDAFVILDEAQNTTPQQMKMFLTRFGMRCHMVICGDPSQVDLPRETQSGLADAVARLEGIDGVAVVRFNARDVVRHPLVGRIVEAYDGLGGGVQPASALHRSRIGNKDSNAAD